MRHFDIARKTASILANLSLLLNSFLPFVLAIQPVNAQSVEELSPTPTPAEIVENSPTPTPEIIINETPTPSPEVTPEVTPEITPEITPEAEITPEVTPTPSSEPVEPTPENNQPQQPQNNNDNQNNNPTPVIEVTPTVLPTITPTPNPVVKEVEQVCLSESDQIRNSVELDWNYDATNDIYETREKVQLGVKYIFPQDNKVTVTFSCLPKDELLRSTLKIKRVKTSDLKLPNIENVGDYAYDITTDMRDGVFKYDITLPKSSDSTAKVSYIEKSLEEATLVAISESEVKSIDNLEQQSDSVKALAIDHFTIFIATYSNSSFNIEKQQYRQGETVYTKATGLNTNKYYKVFIIKPDNSTETIKGCSTNVSEITANYNLSDTASISQNWKAEIREYKKGNVIPDWYCSTNDDQSVISDSFEVISSFSVTTPVLPNNSSDTYAFTSTSGVWTSVSGGSNVTGVNTNEVRWGTTSGEKSGLRFDGAGDQSFNEGDTFYLGALTHLNWPIQNPANGATLQITLDFNRPNIVNQTFSYNFNIDETVNNGSCPYGGSGQNCNDKITFPISFGQTSFQIGDKLYTLRINGFVNSYPSGTLVSQFITEEQRNNTAYLVGTLSSVLVAAPQISLVQKSVNGDDADSTPGQNLYVGDTATFTYVVQNTGNVTMTNIVVHDNMGVSVTCPKTTLISGESMTCTGSSTVVAGQYTNTAHVHGTYNSTEYTSNNESANYFGVVNAVCGDGVKNQVSEECDDGNNDNNDLCSNSCIISHKRITLCHATPVETAANGWNIQTIDDDGIEGEAHDSNHGADIIPAFSYYKNGVLKNYAGKNLNTNFFGFTGQQILNNGCQIGSTLKIIKVVDNTGGGIKSATDFSFSLNGGSYTNFGIGGSNTFTLKIGDTYSVTESTEFSNNYNVSFDNCSGTIDSTQETCTITNTYKPVCGDGVRFGSEECDDGNLVNNDACTNSCKNPTCGDGFVTPSEECDLGSDNALSCNAPYGGSCSFCKKGVCETTTVFGPRCGDETIDTAYGEVCDDGNTTNGDGCNSTCKFEPGTITFVKNAIPDNNQSFHFDYGSNDYPIGDFDLVDDNNGDNSQTVTFNSIPSGTYSWSESNISGWDLTSISCDDGDSNWNLTTKTVNVVLSPAEHVTCTITNTKRAKLTVIKQVDTNNDGVIENSNATDWTWDIKNGEQNIATGQTKELIAGTYTISEDQKSDYRLKQWTCSNETRGTTNSIGVTLNPGDDVTCIITNTRKTGNIRVCKVILDGDGNIVDGSVLPNNTFSLAGLNQTTSQGAPAGVINTTTFITPLSYSEKLFGSRENNAVCTTYENLIPGNYYYGPESLPEEFWGIPKYNDGTASQNNINDHFYEYSGQLFDADSTNDGQRQTSSDGHIVLGADQTRTIIVLNQYQYAKLNVTKFNDFDGDGYQDPDETNLSDWAINLTNQPSVVTDSSGKVTFTDITPTNYTLSETQKDGWMQTNIVCDGEEGIDNDNSHQITLSAGQTLNCKIANRQLGKVTVTKFNDLNGNGQKNEGESNLTNWQINLTDQTSLNTNESGQVVFNNLVPGSYDLSENVQSENGWKQTNIYCEDSGNGVKITKTGEAYGHHGNCEGWNGCKDAATCALWACHVRGYSNLVSYGEGKECTDSSINNCHLFQWGMNYEPPVLSISSNYIDNAYVDYDWGTGCAVKGVTDIVCSNGSSNSGDYYNNGYISGSHLTVSSGQNKICYIGNQRPEPKTTITKSNNSSGVELSPGGSIEYTINVSFADNSVNNLKVTDLLSNGFKYRVGSYKVYKNGNDVTSQVSEPQYHSPGVWNLSDLGELTPSDVVKLIYTADISTDQQAGKYADLAWSIANYSYDSNKTVLALAGSEGHVDTNFVGTQVAVGGNYQNSVSAEVKQENHVTGQVLGASTELPGTGAATIWLIISGLLGLIGFSFLKFNKKTMLTILLTLLTFGLIITPAKAQSVNLSVRLEEPKTPSRIKEIELKYVTLDIQGRGVTAYCLKKGPTDSDFVQFSSETLSGANGNSSHCSLSSAITDNGSYQFQVKAIAGGEESLSNVVSLDYNTSSPGTPIDYRKEQINNCDFKIHFKTADDSGKTVKVELYRSTDSNFSANNESLVVSTNIGSNQEKDIWNNVPDCSKVYYFALRAFDNAGNGSGLVGDKVYTTITDGSTVTTSTTTNSGAIPVGGAVIPKEGEGDQVNPDTTQQEGTGQVLGTRTVVRDFFSRHPITTILIAVLILGIIIYAFKKIRQSKKVSAKKNVKNK